MLNESTYQLSNLSVGTFIDLVVPGDADALTTARAHLAELELPEEVRRGFFISLYPWAQASDHSGQEWEPSDETSPPEASAPETTASETLPVEEPALSTGDSSAPPEDDQSSQVSVSPLQAAAAQGPMNWPDDDQTEANGFGGGRPAEDVRVIPLPLGSAGGH